MMATPNDTRFATVLAGSLAFLAPNDLCLSTASAAEPTTIEELVMYGVPQESQELFRYEFGSDEFSTIGVVTDQFGREVVDLKGLAYIPSGPDKGIYGASEESPFMGHLLKIDALTADATLYSQDMGAGKVSGMVAYLSGGKWYLLTADYGNDLYRIDPATGIGTFLYALKNRYQGLAIDGNGLVYGTTGGGDIWELDLPDLLSGDSSAEAPLGNHGYGGIEALEFAFGMSEPRVEVTGLNNQWVKDGLLFSYGQGNGLLIVNPETGAAIPYPCSIPSLDLEGVVFMPENADRWGMITVNAHD
ncbi:MAG: NHL repeat-containing protein [Planctomycetota bacterium]|jgi:hypothetical protein